MNTHLRYMKLGSIIIAWIGVLLAATYRSHTPVVFGRYSWGYVVLLGLLVGVATALSLARSTWYQPLYQARIALVVCGVSLLLSLGAFELALRLVDPLGLSYYEQAGDYVRDKLPDDQLVFRHKPSWETRYGDVRVTYNERGLRDRPILPKAAGEYRILALGDSVTFGWGVDQDKTFAARLEPLLQRRLHRPVRAINSGVGGYNTVQEVTYFKQEGIALQPDLVMLTYVKNDIEVNKGPFDPRAQSSLWGKSFPDMVMTMVGKLWLYRLIYHTYHYALPESQGGSATTSLHEGTGWRQSMAALHELVVMCEERHIPLIVFFHRLDSSESKPLFDAVVQHAQGVPIKDMGQWYGGLRVSSLVNSKVDGHPNAEGHRVMAEHMAEDIASYLAQFRKRTSMAESLRYLIVHTLNEVLPVTFGAKEGYHEWLCHGTVGLYEGAQEILAIADSGGSAFVWDADRVDARLRGRSIYLYPVLMAEAFSSSWEWHHCGASLVVNRGMLEM